MLLFALNKHECLYILNEFIELLYDLFGVSIGSGHGWHGSCILLIGQQVKQNEGACKKNTLVSNK